MTDELKKQIYNNLDMRETDELLEIWQKNHRFEWSDAAFESIREILISRGIYIPQQDSPIYQQQDQPGIDVDGLTDLEKKIVNDENPPEFYDPFDVLKTSKQVMFVAKAIVFLTLIYNLTDFSSTLRLVQAWFIRNPDPSMVYFITLLVILLNTAIGVVITYFPLMALSRILNVLMQMEYNSRKVNETNKTPNALRAKP